MYTGSQHIMDAFDTLKPNTPYYSVWIGRDLFFQYNESDAEKGRDMLEKIVVAGEEQGNTDLMDIKFHAKLDNGYITNKTPVIGTLRVRCAGFETADGQQVSGMQVRGNDLPAPVYRMLVNIENSLPGITERLAKLETATVGAVEKEPDWFDRISGLLSQPGMMESTVNLLQPIISRFIPGMPAANIQVAGVQESPVRPVINTPVAGNNNAPGELESVTLTDEQNEIIDNAIAELSDYCDVVDCLPLLAKFAKENTQMFKMLITQLHS
jgi:hypothetical protein